MKSQLTRTQAFSLVSLKAHCKPLLKLLVTFSIISLLFAQLAATSLCYAATPVSTTPTLSAVSSDADKPVKLTNEQMKQYYFINLTLQYKALDTRIVPGDKTTFIQPDSDFGLLDTSWQNGSNSDPACRKQHNDVLAKYRAVKFRFFDNTTNQEATNIRELDFGDPVNISRIFFGFNPDHEYKISIVGETVPSPVALGFSLRHADHTSPVATTLTFQINKQYSLSSGAPVEKGDNWNIPYQFIDLKDHFVKTTLFMLPMEFIFANSADDAKDALTIKKDPVTADKYTFVYHNEKIFKRVRIKDNKLDIPTEVPKRAGYKFLGWGYNLLFPKKADGTPDDDQNAYTIHNVLECTRQRNLTPDQENKCYSDYTNWAAETMRFDARHMRPAYQWSIIRDGVINKYGMQKDFLHAESPVFIVFAVWKKLPSYTVMFDPNGGVLSGPAQVQVNQGDLVPKPTDPTKQNCTFMGWFVEDKQWDFNSQKVTSAVTLVAMWKENPKKEDEDPRFGTLYRLYNPYTHEHFFTAETVENDNLVRLGWKSEGGVGYIYKHGEKGGVYRLYNSTTGEHHYTMNEDEVATCVKAGWKNEGVKWFSAQDKEVTLNKLYSMYNPYEKKFYHHYTADAKEIEQMVKDGWRKEEVKWCTLPVSAVK